MREGVREVGSETNRKEALNKAENPSRPLAEGPQMELGRADDRCRVGASRMAAFAHDSVNLAGVTLGTVGGLIGKDAVAAHRAFDVQDPCSAFRLLAALLLLDKNRLWLSGVCRMFGGEFVERPRLTKEQKYELVVAKLREMGRVGQAVLDEALGEETP